tara:strand:+ start:2394 stop:4136 length:1743 start_codon:yes stop_codon:yes gene_type:complete
MRFKNTITPVNGSNDAIFRFKNIAGKTVRGEWLFKNVTGGLCEMEILAIIGDNRSGKNDLIRCLSTQKGMLKGRYSGSISAHSKTSLQHVDTLPDDFTVYEIMTYYATMKGINFPWVHEMLNILSNDIVDLKSISSRKFRTLSTFEKMLVKIAAQYPRLHSTLLIEEPFRFLSGIEQLTLMKSLRLLANSGPRIILTIDTIRSECLKDVDTILLLIKGVPVYYGLGWQTDISEFMTKSHVRKKDVMTSDVDALRDSFYNVPDVALKADRRYDYLYNQPIPPYYQLSTIKRGFSRALFCGVFHRMWTHINFKAELYKIAIISFIAVGVFSKHSHLQRYSQHYRLCMSFLWTHVFLSMSKCRASFKEVQIYKFEQKQRFYSPFLYAAVHTLLDICIETILSIIFSCTLFVLLSATRIFGFNDQAPFMYMITWGVVMRLCTTYISQIILYYMHKNGYAMCLYTISIILGVQIAASGILSSPETMSRPFQFFHFLSFPSHAMHATYNLLKTPAHPVPWYIRNLSPLVKFQHLAINMFMFYMLRLCSFISIRSDYKYFSMSGVLVILSLGAAIVLLFTNAFREEI